MSNNARVLQKKYLQEEKMIKRYRINQKIVANGKINTFDINIEESKIPELVNMLEGKITVWENIIEDKGELLETAPNKKIKYIDVFYNTYKIRIKSYKGNIFLKKEYETKELLKIIKENTHCMIEHKKPRKIYVEHFI